MGRLFDELDDNSKQLIKRHLELVIEANKTTNLTRIENLEEGMLLHVEDSLSGLDEVNAAPNGTLVDIGSGAGYPGIPLAIATKRPALLVDSRQKKMNIVQDMVNELGLNDQIETYAGRAELLARSRKGEFSVVTARALSKISVLLELASPLLCANGHLVCYKANIDEEEMADAERVAPIVGMKITSDRAFDLDGYSRRIVVFKKSDRPKVKLPRLEGQAQKNPL